MQDRDLGRLGESIFQCWASQVGMVATKSDPDKTGWDFFLELPPERDNVTTTNLPLDKLPGPVQCLVQVKSTDRTKRNWSIKLTNWRTFIGTQLPAFFVILEFDGLDECQRAYLVHVGREYICRVLKRLREIPTDQFDDLHHKTHQFEYREDDRLPTPNGKALLDAIRSHVGDINEYSKGKNEIQETCGYEADATHIRFVFPLLPGGKNIQEHLVDWSLGLVPAIGTEKAEILDVRFGNVAQQPTETLGPSTVRMVDDEPPRDAMIVLETPRTSKQIRLSTRFFSPRGFGFDIDDEFFKIRFAAPFIDFIIWPFLPGKASIQVSSPASGDEHDLQGLNQLSEFLLLLDEAGANNDRIQFEATIDSKPATTGHIDVSGRIDNESVRFSQVVKWAAAIARHFEVYHLVRLNLGELYQQKEQLEFVASVLGHLRPPITVAYSATDNPTDDDKKICVPYVTCVTVGQYRMAIAVAIMGESTLAGENEQRGRRFDEYRIETREMVLHRQHCWEHNLDSGYTPEELVQSVVEEYEESFHIQILEEPLVESIEPISGENSSD